MHGLKRKNVLLLMEWYDHSFREGIGRFAGERQWILTVNDGCTLPDGWHGDGIVTYFDTRQDIIDYLAGADVPVVSLSDFRPDIRIPSVTGDNVGIGGMAADFFLKKGFTHAAYFSTRLHRLQKLRMQGFARRWRLRTGNRIQTIVPELDQRRAPADDWAALGAYIREKLLAAPRPLAVFAYCDYDAAKVEAAALEVGLRIPEDVAILGVDNDPLVCEHCAVPLSSVCQDRERIGYEGAAMLERLMVTGRVRCRSHTVRPACIVERASTHGISADDPLARRVIAFFNAHLDERVGVAEAAAALGIAQRQLERHFAANVGRTMTSYLRELRLTAARQLVLNTDRRMGEIASACGFSNAQHFSNVYRAACGLTPSQARKRQHMERGLALCSGNSV